MRRMYCVEGKEISKVLFVLGNLTSIACYSFLPEKEKKMVFKGSQLNLSLIGQQYGVTSGR